MQPGPTRRWYTLNREDNNVRAVKTLEEMGIVREVTGLERERVFAYGGYFNLLAQVAAGG